MQPTKWSLIERIHFRKWSFIIQNDRRCWRHYFQQSSCFINKIRSTVREIFPRIGIWQLRQAPEQKRLGSNRVNPCHEIWKRMKTRAQNTASNIFNKVPVSDFRQTFTSVRVWRAKGNGNGAFINASSDQVNGGTAALIRTQPTIYH